MKNILFIGLTCLLCLYSCQTRTETSTASYDIELVEAKKITLPVDENTYYMSRIMFQFEEDGKEYLLFQNTEKTLYDLIVFDIEQQKVAHRIPLQKEGPNGVSSVFGCKPFFNSDTLLLFQHNIGRTSIYTKKGELVKSYSARFPDGGFRHNQVFSYLYQPGFIKDSVVYIADKGLSRNMKKKDWLKAHLFTAQDLRTGNVWKLPLTYPSVFDMEVKNPAGGEGFSYDYNHSQERLVCSFCGYDSIMVTDDLQNVRWYNGKSRFLESMRPHVYEASGLNWLREYKESGKYWHFMYDKYRDVYYRFAKMPCELGPGEYPMDEPKAREFSIIIFDKDFNIIGETKFPGNKYFYKMSFVGRDGLYISENNLANPDFDENKLVFACFKLEDVN